MLRNWLDATEAKKFGSEMALLISQRTPIEGGRQGQIKSAKKIDKKHDATLALIEKKLTEFKKTNQLNVYKKAQLGSTFKYALIDNGYDQEFAEKTTTWLLLKCK